MTFLVERLAGVRRQLEHLRELRPRIDSPRRLRSDLSLHNDVLFSLLSICQGVIDVAGELASRRGIRFEDYTGAVRALETREEFPDHVVEDLASLPGFRNVLVHEYVELDYSRVMDALDRLDTVEEFVRIAAELEARGS